MSFFKSETSFDLSDTPIENIFIDVYMPMADGDYVKVYLYSYKYACDPSSNTDVNNATISKHLNIPLSDVLAAWDFWEEKQIIKKHKLSNLSTDDYAVEFINIKQLFINNTTQTMLSDGKKHDLTTSNAASTKRFIASNQMLASKQMFSDLSKILERQLTPNEKRQILGWQKDYNIDSALVLRAFDFCKQKKNIKNVRYVEKKIIGWYDLGISDEEHLDRYLSSVNMTHKLYNRIFKALGFRFRSPSEEETKIMDNWIEQYQFGEEIILKACESSSKISNVSISYINGILSSWHKKGVKKVSDIEIFEHRGRKKTSSSSATLLPKPKPKTKFHLSKSRGNEYSAEELEGIFLDKHSKT
ncbi:MAG: DnaD domain protein [Alkaliphilus sp.]